VNPSPPPIRTTTYAQALAALQWTYEAAQAADIEPAVDLHRQLLAGDAIFVASGGGIAAAEFAADLHTRATGGLARAMTPLEFAGMPVTTDVGVMLLSARARHPDVVLAAFAARRGGHRPIGLLTLEEPANLPPRLRSLGLLVAAFPQLGGKEGFLATRALLAQIVLLARTYGWTLPTFTEILQPPHPTLSLRSRCLVLTAPGLRCVAMDLETRLHELGTTAVQIADYRNFAHGRHTGFARRFAETTVLALVDPNVARLAEATLDCLPSDTDLIKLTSSLQWPAGPVALLVKSMYLAGQAGSDDGIDPSKPRVPEFGRRLYHVSARRLVRLRTVGPVERKLAQIHAVSDQGTVRKLYQANLMMFLKRMGDQSYTGLLLDYDGTCCTTAGRFNVPPSPIQTELLRILRADVRLGFASGRGRSLHRDLRRWLPEELWPLVTLGLYNGALTLSLDCDIEEPSGTSGDLQGALERIQVSPIASEVQISARQFQIGVQSTNGLDGHRLARVLQEIVDSPPKLAVRVASSAHAADVVPATSSKAHVLGAFQASVGGPVIAIGDQGQYGGNDFEFLSSEPFSLSVDRCSADPTRCWNLDRWGDSGPDLLVRYLRASETRHGQLHFVWKP
jgi:hypothetical protein